MTWQVLKQLCLKEVESLHSFKREINLAGKESEAVSLNIMLCHSMNEALTTTSPIYFSQKDKILVVFGYIAKLFKYLPSHE